MNRALAVVLAAALAGAAFAQEAPAPRHGIAMHGEPKYGPDFKHFDYVDPEAPKGGEVRMHAIGTFDNLNPFIIRGMAPVGATLPFESLLTSSADEAFTEYGLIAESIEVPEDRSWVAFTLRPEARFHDGKPITVEDVIFSLEVLKTKGVPLYRFYYAGVTKAEKVGERKVRFSFAEGDNRELPLIVGQMPILPRHYWEGRSFDQTTLAAPLGSGPYRVGRFEPGRYVVYERVEDWWGKDLPVSVGQYNFDRIRYDYYRDTTVALEAFKAGEYDYRVENESKKWATGYDSPALRQGLYRIEKVDHERPTGMQGYVFNTRRPLFQDPKVRRALAYAFDFEWTNRNLFHGQYTRTASYFSNSELAAAGLPSPEELALLEPLKEQVPPDVFTAEYRPPATDGTGNIRDNLRAAMKLLNEAGWEVREGRLTHTPSGRPFEFEILLNAPTWERISLPFARNLERLGITASVRTVDTAQYKNRIDSFDFDIVVDVWGQSPSPGNEQREYWGSQSADAEGSRNTAGIKSAAVDKLVGGLIAAPDRESLVTRTRALDRVLLWGHYVIPHWHIGYDRIAYWDKFGRPGVTPMQGVQFLAWWIDPAKAQGVAARRPAVIAAQAQEPAAPPEAVAPPGGAPQASPPPPITETPATPPGPSPGSDPYETAPADEAVPTPAADSPGTSPWVWTGLVAIVVLVIALRYWRRRRQ